MIAKACFRQGSFAPGNPGMSTTGGRSASAAPQSPPIHQLLHWGRGKATMGNENANQRSSTGLLARCSAELWRFPVTEGP